MRPALKYENRKEAARQEWYAHPEKQKAISDWLDVHGSYPQRNPFFFIQDFTVRANHATPQFLRGDEQGDLVQVRYQGRIKICTRETMEDFGLEWFAYWKNYE